MKKKTAPSETQLLAYAFVKEFLGIEFDYRVHKSHLTQAQRLVNPKPDKESGEKVKRYTMAEVLGCLRCLKCGMFGFNGVKITSLGLVLYGEPASFIEQYLIYANTPPPAYNQVAIREWESLTGKQYPMPTSPNDVRPPTIVLPVALNTRQEIEAFLTS